VSLDLTEPVLIESAFPKVAPRNPLIFQSDPQTSVDYAEINDQVFLFQDTNGFRLSVSAVDSLGSVVAVSLEGAIVLRHGDFVALSGEGFQAGSDAVVWLFSTPRQLGIVRVRTNGAFSERLQIVDDVELGPHTIQVNGVSAEGAVRSLNLAVVVRATSTPTPIAIDSKNQAMESTPSSRSMSLPIAVVGLLVIAAFAAGLLVPRQRGRTPKS
jgi:hypothetical protein